MELTEAHDRCLAERAAAGDDAAFAALVGRHREALVGFVARRTGGRRTIAEDAVQDALLSALHALRGGDPPRDVKAWLHTVAWRRAVDLLRREAPAAPASAWQDVRTVDGLDVAVADAWELDRMLGHWAGLPHRQRHALAMRVLEGRSLEEIGRELGVSPVAAKSLVARSRRSLAHAVASGEPHPRRVSRRRPLMFLPPALVERLRELATFATQHEAPASLVSKACAGACAAVLAGGTSTAVVAVAPVEPLVRPAVERAVEAKPKREKPARREQRAPQPTPAAVAPVPTPTPAPQRTAPQRTQGAETGAARTEAQIRGGSRTPSPLATGGDEGGATESPPQAQPEATPTPAPTADPAGTPAATADPAAGG